jgi:hypothetical protein
LTAGGNSLFVAATMTARGLGFVILLLAGCASGSNSHDSGDASDDGGATDASASADAPRAPDLNNITIASPPVLTWAEPTPCDTVEIEREDMINPYPATPQFTVPGSMLTYTDTTAHMSGNAYIYRARCVVGAARSAWSNEVAWVAP